MTLMDIVLIGIFVSQYTIIRQIFKIITPFILTSLEAIITW